MNNYIKPNWPAPKNIQAYTSKRMGGVSRSPYNSFNFSLLTGDNPDDVLANRKQLCQELKLLQEPCWLKQEHSDLVLSIDNHSRSGVVADASFTTTVGLVSVVLTADCVPILVGDRKGRIVAAIHAGWKGIASRIIGNTIEAMNINPEDLLAWLGPAIGPEAFVVTDEVYEIFSQKLPESKATFIKQDDHFFANIYLLASLRLKEAGVTKIYGGEYCTFTQKELFFSYRRDGKNSGRMATLIWLDA